MAPRTRSSARTETPTLTVQEEYREPLINITASDYAGSISDGDSELEVAKSTNLKRGHKGGQSPDTPAEPPVRRARGKRGKLRGLMNMPIEVFTEISKYLYPLDLVLLARSNKFFRRLLMNRSAMQTWRHALNNIPELPPCPKELCEPQYAALLFSKHCSMCGNQVLRSMNPILQARLCTSCCDSQLIPVGYREQNLVPMFHIDVYFFSLIKLQNSADTSLAKKSSRTGWCLRHDSAAVLAKLDELDLAGDRTAIVRWKEKRMQDIGQRYEDAQPLIEFLKQMRSDQMEDLAARKGGREEEIHARLLELGWDKTDFRMREKQDNKKWKSLVCVAKPFTERNWQTILPQLTPLLEHNKELRLEAEAAARKQQRQTRLLSWIYLSLQNLPPYAWVIESSRTAEELSVSKNTTDPISIAPTGSLGGESGTADVKSSNRILKSPTPTSSLVFSWTPFQLLLETDILNEQFEATLEETRPTLMALLTEWRSKVEQTLANRLPPNSPSDEEALADCEPNSTSTALNTIPVLDILVDSRPIRSLPLNVQRLFRADTVLARCYAPGFYPDGFQRCDTDEAIGWHYDEKTSNAAKALLATLGRPNATYLEMKAAGPIFTCGRCCSRNCVTWSQMVNHHSDEKKRSNAIRMHSSVKDGTVVYVPTHDVQSTGRPLVKMANEEDRKLPYNSTRSFACCLICWSMDSYNNYPKPAIIEHLHDVHLIQDPEIGKHYR